MPLRVVGDSVLRGPSSVPARSACSHPPRAGADPGPARLSRGEPDQDARRIRRAVAGGAGAAGDGPGAESLNRRDQLGSDGLPARRVASWLLLLSGALSGIGIGLAQAAMTETIIESVPASQTAIATSDNAIVRTIGGSLGSAVLAEILTSHADPHGIPAERVFTTGFWICAAVAASGVLAALALPAT